MALVTKLQTCLGIIRVNQFQVLCKRFCSQATNIFNSSNIGFPSFSTTLNQTNPTIQKIPNISVVSTLIVYGKPHVVNQSKKFDPDKLLEESLSAVEAVTKTLATNNDLLASNVSELMTNKCYNQITSVFSNDEGLKSKDVKEHLYIPKEDVFFAWIKQDKTKTSMRVVTMSFPCAGYMYENRKLWDKKDLEKLKYNHLKKNDVICSNWDFVKVSTLGVPD